jgi:ADP-ribose pyrophosphatase YjhB (NUDIX family)
MKIENCWYRISVKALIYNEEWKILLCKENNGFWDLPWWWLEHWENYVNCIKRELKEEMWLEVIFVNENPKYFITVHKQNSKTKPWIANICYETKVKDLNFISSNECTEIWFFYFEEVKNMNVLVNLVELFK